jgi:hypothetical protein
MSHRYNYKYETFRADDGKFNQDFSAYLNERASDNWRVMQCSYSHGCSDGKSYASCLFERKS